MPIAWRCFRFNTYWSSIASGAFASHWAATSGWGLPSTLGRSKYRGGLLGLGDQAAAEAIIARVPKSVLARSAALWMASAFASASVVGFGLGIRQQALIA